MEVLLALEVAVRVRPQLAVVVTRDPQVEKFPGVMQAGGEEEEKGVLHQANPEDPEAARQSKQVV